MVVLMLYLCQLNMKNRGPENYEWLAQDNTHISYCSQGQFQILLSSELGFLP